MWGRSTAGIFAGFFAAAGLVGLGMWALPGPWQGTLVTGFLCLFPVWMGLICLSFLFSSGRSAWAWLGGLALVSLALLWTAQRMGWLL